MWEVYDFLARGGPIMIPIALGSVTALAIFLERLWTLRKVNVIPPKLLAGVKALISQGDYDKAFIASQKSFAPMARILTACLRYRVLSRGEIKESIENVGRQEVAQMSRLVEALGIIAAVSPLLGLLGTVTGMIQAFRQVVEASAQGSIDPSRLANGIWEALITTAAGLSVAIISYLGYRYLGGRANRLATEMEQHALDVLDVMTDVKNLNGVEDKGDDGSQAVVEEATSDEAEEPVK